MHNETTTKSVTDTDPHAWAHDLLARVDLDAVGIVGMLRAVEVLTDDPARREALRSALEASDAALPSIARDLAELAAQVRDVAEVLTGAARASSRGENVHRGVLVAEARDRLRAALANDVFELAHDGAEVSAQ